MRGGVAWRGSPRELYEANLRLRTASRVLVRVARFDARSFSQLERRAREVDWSRYVGAGTTVRLNVTCRKSKLYHQRAVGERVMDAIERSGGVAGHPIPRRRGSRRDEPPFDEDDAEELAASPDDGSAAEPATRPQLFVVRVEHDRCTISADSSGALLHRRGYRIELARAPLRETLAAAMLLACGWQPDQPLLDPMCGSGTIAIEAALISRRIAPGLACMPRRRFAFEAWPDHDAAILDALVSEADAEALDAAAAPIRGSDRDAGAIRAAAANAARAGVAADIALERTALAAAPAPEPAGWLVTNPPYGGRVGDSDRLRDLYAAVGNLMRGRLGGWSLAMLSADRRLEAQTSLAFDEVLRTRNGGIPVRLVRARSIEAAR